MKLIAHVNKVVKGCLYLASSSSHFLSRPQAPNSRLTPLGAFGPSISPSHTDLIYHHSAYPLVYFAPEMPE